MANLTEANTEFTPRPTATISHDVPAPLEIDHEALYLAQKAETERLQAIITHGRPSVAPRSVQPAIRADQVKAQMGAVGFLNAGRVEKLERLGLDPKSVNDAYLKSAFGRGSDPIVGADLMRSNPAKYSALKQAALLLNIYGS